MQLVLYQIREPLEYDVSLVDFIALTEEEGVESIVELVHKVAFKELMSRTLDSVWGWEMRTLHMFENNNLHVVENVAMLPAAKVNRLVGCGYTTRKEVYEVFCAYHLRLKFWEPEKHYSRMHYKF